MNEMVTDDRRQGLVLPGPGRWGWYDAAAYERVEQRHRQDTSTADAAAQD